MNVVNSTPPDGKKITIKNGRLDVPDKPVIPYAKILIKDAIADITLQQVLTRPAEFDVIATMNLNGDYLSDALAAQVGGIGIAPGGNINYDTGRCRGNR